MAAGGVPEVEDALADLQEQMLLAQQQQQQQQQQRQGKCVSQQPCPSCGCPRLCAEMWRWRAAMSLYCPVRGGNVMGSKLAQQQQQQQQLQKCGPAGLLQGTGAGSAALSSHNLPPSRPLPTRCACTERGGAAQRQPAHDAAALAHALGQRGAAARLQR